ncbi:MAG TPA: RNA pseudouridine synthase [Bacilli bacterium]
MKHPSCRTPILYEDNHLLVVEKPVNMPTQEDKSGDPDLLTILKQDLKIRYNKPGNVFLGLVHRLDRPVGGAMVFARTSKAASRLSECIRARKFGKTYLAVLRGIPAKKSARLIHHLRKNERTNTVSVVAADVAGAKEASLEYEMLAFRDNLCLVRIRLLTGRPHQIRVQFQAIGCPLYGDQKYGASVNKPGEQLALWSHQLRFPHPTRDEMMEFHSFPPAEWPWRMWELHSF